MSMAAGFVGQNGQGEEKRRRGLDFLCSVSRAEGSGKQRCVWDRHGENLAFSKS